MVTKSKTTQQSATTTNSTSGKRNQFRILFFVCLFVLVTLSARFMLQSNKEFKQLSDLLYGDAGINPTMQSSSQNDVDYKDDNDMIINNNNNNTKITTTAKITKTTTTTLSNNDKNNDNQSRNTNYNIEKATTNESSNNNNNNNNVSTMLKTTTTTTTTKDENNIIIKQNNNFVVEVDNEDLSMYLPPVNLIPPTNIHYDRSAIVDFEHQPGVVVASKIHGPESWGQLQQSMCLFHYAYNNRVLYDIYVFSTLPVPDPLIQNLQSIMAPANFTLVVDNPGLEKRLDDMHPGQLKTLMERCNVTSKKDINWDTYCRDGHLGIRLGYTWQCEFRAFHLWTRPELAPYKYMLWLDSDGMSTKVWPQDPVAAMIRNKLAIFYAHFPMGKSAGPIMAEKIERAFNRSLCNVKLMNGKLNVPHRNEKCKNRVVQQIHGFFHITDLDFYRSPPVMKWFQILIGNTTYSRLYDDQIGVTVPAAILAPGRSWEMEAAGVKPEVYHNGRLDGKQWVGGGFINSYWNKNGSSHFPEAYGKCDIVNAGR